MRRLLSPTARVVCRVTTLSLLITVVLSSPASANGLPDFGAEPVQGQDPSVGGCGSIVDIRLGDHPGFDRLTIECAEPVGSFGVSYVDQVLGDNSGDPVPIAGSAFIQVGMTGISNDSPNPVPTTGLSELIEVVPAGGPFEGAVSYGLGTAHAGGFRAFTLEGPARLVIDVAKPEAASTPTTTAPTASATSGEIPASSAGGTPVAAADKSPTSSTALLILIGVVAVAIAGAIVGWRLRGPGLRWR